MRVLEIVGVVLVILLAAVGGRGMVGDAFDGAWGLREVARDVIEWLRARKA